MNADRNLLLGILALQNNFIDRKQLLAAFDQWLTNKTQPLGQLLEDQDALSSDRRALLEALMAEHLKLHDDDVEKSLADLTPVDSLCNELKRLGDIDVEASLCHLAAVDDDNMPVTRSWGAGEASSAGARFRVLRPHARGGLGEVYVAHDEELRREVALKEIQARHAHDPNSRSRFLLEAEITGGLEHPGIVPVYGLGTYGDGRPFYAMRFIKGDSLKEAIDLFHNRIATREHTAAVTLADDVSGRVAVVAAGSLDRGSPSTSHSTTRTGSDGPRSACPRTARRAAASSGLTLARFSRSRWSWHVVRFDSNCCRMSAPRCSSGTSLPRSGINSTPARRARTWRRSR